MSSFGTAKAALHRRLHAEGRWQEYVLIREQLKREGVSPYQAWKIAAQQFPPLDGSPMEVESPVRAGMPKRRKAKAGQPDTKGAAAEEFFLDGSVGIEEDGGDAEGGELDDGPPRPPDPPTSRAGKWVIYSKAVRSELLSAEDHWNELVSGVDRSRQAGIRQIAEWVFNHHLVPLHEIAADDVPSMGALSLLKWVRSSPANYSEFIRSIWSKMLPTRSQIETEGRFADDGRKQFSLLSEFEASLLEGEANESE